MKPPTHSLWTIAELGQQVQDALTADPLTPRNGRIRAVPDGRTIRYYTTIGLIDRPVAMRGRTALYSDRHLHQLISIKRLQAQGLSLAEVQQTLANLPDEELATLSGLSSVSSPTPQAMRKTSSHTELPDHTSDTAVKTSPEIAYNASGTNPILEPPAAPHSDLYHGFALAPGVTLLLQGARALSADDIHALRHAAAPLLDVLRQQRRNGANHPETKT